LYLSLYRQTAYLKLYSTYVPHLIVALGLALFAFFYLRAAGMHTDPFTGKKKIVLIDDQYEKSFDGYLREVVYGQLCGSVTIPDQSGNFVQRNSREI
jgi:hypothetical protein